MNVRLATSEDAEAISSHNVALAQESEGCSIDPETAFQGVTTLLQRPDKGFYMVAENKDVVVGQLMVTFEWSDWRAQDIWWLQSIYVLPQWRRQGIMRQLIAAVSDMAAGHKVRELRLYVHMDNQLAIKAYQHLHMHHLSYHVFSLPVSDNR